MPVSRALLPSLMFSGLTLFLTACSRPDIDTSELIRPVRVVELSASATSSIESFAGQIQPRFDSSLSFQVGGKLIARSAEVGQRVKKGQVLAKIDPQDLRLAVQAAQAQLDAANLEFVQVQTDLERFKKLRAENFISQAELDRRQLALDAASSRLKQARAQFNVQSNQNQYGELRAPNDGVIARVFAEVGQVVAPGQAVVQWANENAVEVGIAVPESKVAELKPGQKARVELWSGEKALVAKIREISPLADPVTRAFEVHLDVDDPNRVARFGMSATVVFEHALQDQSFKLPITALVAEHTGAYVWVFDEANGVVNKRKVEPHDVSESAFLVKSGLKNGELIVTAGTHVLTEGQKVRRFIETKDLAPSAAKAQ